MEKGIKKDIIDFYNDMMANRFDCITIEVTQGEERLERSIVYYTRSIVVEKNEETQEETRSWKVTPHVLMTSIDHPEIDEELDINDVYVELKKMLFEHGFMTIEYVRPTILVNCAAIAKDNEGKPMIYSESQKDALAKFFKGNRHVEYTPNNIQFKEKDDIKVLFYDGLTLERKHKQPTKIGSFIVDRTPGFAETTRMNDAEFYFKKEEAEREAAEKPLRDRRKHLIKVAHKVLKEQRAKREREEREKAKLAKEEAERIANETEEVK